MLQKKRKIGNKERRSCRVTQLVFYCGWPKAWSVFPLVDEVYKDGE